MRLDRLETSECLVAGALFALTHKLLINIHLNGLKEICYFQGICLARTRMLEMILLDFLQRESSSAEATEKTRHDDRGLEVVRKI